MITGPSTLRLDADPKAPRRWRPPGLVAALCLVSWCGATLAATATATATATAVPPVSAIPADAAPDALSRFGVFVEPLVAFTTPRARDRQKLEAAVAAYRAWQAKAAPQAQDPAAADAYGRVEPLLAYLAAEPTSPWRVSLLANIGWRYQQLGYTSRALEYLAQAQAAAGALRIGGASPEVKQQLDALIGTQLQLHARLGHLAQTQALLADPRAARLGGAADQQAAFARSALAQMRDTPEDALRCGWVALGQLLKLQGAPAALQQQVQGLPAGPTGTSLAELAMWSQANAPALGLQALRRAAGEPLPVPSVVHLKTGHFATVAATRGSGAQLRVRLIDSVLGEDAWVSPQALESESSGFYLAPARAGGGWQSASAAEAAGVIGAGNPRTYSPKATSPTEISDGGNNVEPPCGADGFSQPTCQSAAAGMPVYSVQSLNVGLAIRDTPVSYSPPVGPRMAFTLYYSQKEQGQPATFTFSNLGPKWTHNWLAYVQDDPANIGSSVSTYQRGGGGWSYTGYNPADGSFAREGYRTQLVLVSSSPVRYQRLFADGSKEVYSRSDGSAAAPRRVFLTQVVDSSGNTVSLAYDSLNRLITLTDAIGQVTTLGYASASSRQIATVTDPFGRVASLNYNPQGQLGVITDAINLPSSFAYDASGNVNSMTTPYGTTTFAFAVVSPFIRWLEVTDPLGAVERVEYNSGANNMDPAAAGPPSMSVEQGRMNLRNTFYFDKVAYRQPRLADGSFDYTTARAKHWAETDAEGRPTAAPVLLASKSPLGVWEWYQYANMRDDTGQPSPKTVTDTWQLTSSGRILPNGSSRVSLASYNDAGNRTAFADPLGRLTTYTYAANQIDLQQISQQDSTGSKTEVVYKGASFVWHKPRTVTDAAGRVTTYTYNGAGQVRTETNPLGEVTTYGYDANFRLLTITRAGVVQFTYTYDAVGRVRTERRADGYQKTYDYDNLDRLTQVTYPDGTSDITTWNQLDVASTTNRLRQTTRFTFDAMRNLKQATDAGNAVTQFGYDANGALLTLKDANQRTTTWQRDAEGRVSTKTYPGGARFTTTYDSAGREETRTDAEGQTRTISYYPDGAVRLQSYSLGSAPKQEFTYDAAYPRLSTMTDVASGDVTSLSYVPAGTDGAGQLYRETNTNSSARPVTLVYDELGRPKQRTVGTRVSTYAYDTLGRLSNTTNTLGSFTTSYLGQSNRPLLETLAGAQWQTQYDWADNLHDRMLKSITHTPPGLTRNKAGMSRLQALARTLGLSDEQSVKAGVIPQGWASSNDIGYTTTTGQITTRTQGADSWSYRYDATQRLTGATHTGTGTGLGAAIGYDAADNITSLESDKAGSRTTYLPNADNQVANATAAATGRSFTWKYDANGNVKDDGTNTYAWDAENRLTRSTAKRGGQISSFTYDGMGRRIGVTETVAGAVTTTTRYIWCPGSTTPCAGNINGVVTFYEPQGEFRAAATPTKFYYARDHLGSVMQVVDAEGTVLGQRQYTVYGQAYQVSGTLPTMGYAAMLYHPASGLSLTPFRAYSASHGRWLSRDPIGEEGGINLYTYVQGDPLNSVDLLGLVDIPSPSAVPGGPWTPNDLNRPGNFMGPKSPNGGGRAQCQFVPDEANGGPPGSKGYWKTNQPGQKGWQRYDLNGNPIEAAEAHRIPAPRIPGLAPLLCPLCGIVLEPFVSPNGPS